MTCLCITTHWALIVATQSWWCVNWSAFSHFTNKLEPRLFAESFFKRTKSKLKVMTLWLMPDVTIPRETLGFWNLKRSSASKYCKTAQRITRSFCYRSVGDEHSQRSPTAVCFSLSLEHVSVHECRRVMHLCRNSEGNKRNVYLGGLASVLLERFFLKGPASCTYTLFPGHFPLQCWSLSLLSPCHSHSRPRHC